MATAIWALSEIVKKPSQDMIDFIENVKSDAPEVLEEQATFLEIAKMAQV
ncbi:Uncharacterised protein [Chlamydia trachomatis]|nr:Uncharacterised protein [Chlamydia trachomatis]